MIAVACAVHRSFADPVPTDITGCPVATMDAPEVLVTVASAAPLLCRIRAAVPLDVEYHVTVGAARIGTGNRAIRKFFSTLVAPVSRWDICPVAVAVPGAVSGS